MYFILGNAVDDGQRPKHTSLLLQYIIVSTGIVPSLKQRNLSKNEVLLLHSQGE